MQKQWGVLLSFFSGEVPSGKEQIDADVFIDQEEKDVWK